MPESITITDNRNGNSIEVPLVDGGVDAKQWSKLLPGIWFFSLDAARLGAVVVARKTYHLPYFWSDMSVEHQGHRLRYRSHRRWPDRRRPRSDVAVDVGWSGAPET